MNGKQYIREIAERTCLPKEYRKKIVKDLMLDLQTARERGESDQEFMIRMGDADLIAEQIYEQYISSLPLQRPFTEYKSDKELFGLPLVHIVKAAKVDKNIDTSSGQAPRIPSAFGFIAIGRRAKGVIAIGNLSTGILAIGNFSIGIITIANIGVGILGIGNLMFAICIILANLGIGVFAMGMMAIGYGAIGSVAIGMHAFGDVAVGVHTIHNSMIYLTDEYQQFLITAPPVVREYFKLFSPLYMYLDKNPIAGYAVLVIILIAGLAFGSYVVKWFNKAKSRSLY